MDTQVPISSLSSRGAANTSFFFFLVTSDETPPPPHKKKKGGGGGGEERNEGGPWWPVALRGFSRHEKKINNFFLPLATHCMVVDLMLYYSLASCEL